MDRKYFCYNIYEDGHGLLQSNDVETEIPDSVEWELRFFCRICDKEISETETTKHRHEEKLWG